MAKYKAKGKKTKACDLTKVSLTWGSCFKFWVIGFVMFILFGVLWVGFSFLSK